MDSRGSKVDQNPTNKSSPWNQRFMLVVVAKRRISTWSDNPKWDEKKIDLEKFQIENPGFDFSGAKLDKQYEDKGVKQMQDAVDSLKINKS